MSMLDPRLSQTCPKCRQLLVFVAAEGSWRFYRCGRHRTVVLSRVMLGTRWQRFKARLGVANNN
jgi:hypothetical protein